jgi:hypothetical protein
MLGLWRTWIDANRFAIETQQVIALRLMRLASGDMAAAREAHRMVAEKIAAGVAAQAAAAAALIAGASFMAVARSAARPYRVRVRTNHRRLTGRH